MSYLTVSRQLKSSIFNPNGYTLIEIMIALAVFAILAVITSTAMYHAFNTRSKINQQANRLNELQLAMIIIQRDTEQVINRPIRTHDMQLLPPFTGDAASLEFTRDGLVNPNSREKRSTLKRVKYICSKDKLIRRSWLRLDTPHREQFEEKLLLNNLHTCSFAYVDRTRQILSEWRENAIQSNQKKEPLPSAIQMNITLEDWGNASWLFVIPEALYG